MKKLFVVPLILLFLGVGVTGAQGADIALFEWAFNIDGVLSEITLGDPKPAELTDLDFDEITGLGTLTWATDIPGLHTFLAFFDHEIDTAANTYFNENGQRTGTPDTGQSWEIDEPGYVFGDIHENFLNGNLDNSNAVPAGSEDDVSMAMGWDFSLSSGQTAIITLLLSETMPNAGFYLQQTDPDSDVSIYFSSTLNVTGGGSEPVPEPATMLLVGSGLVGLLGMGRRKFMRK